MFSTIVFLYPILFFAGLVAGRIISEIVGRYCQGSERAEATLSRIFLVGLASATLCLLNFHYFGFTAGFFKYVIISNLLLLVSCMDVEVGLIPNRFVFIIFLWVFLWQFFYPFHSLLSAIIGFLAGGGLFYLITMLSGGGMGGGDVKLMAVLGLAAGWPDVLMIILLSFVLGAVAGLVLMICRKKTRRDALSFAPFLSLAFLLVSFWGGKIWQWYLVSL